MCHDLRTCDTFYLMNLSAQGAERSPLKQSPRKRKRPLKSEKSKKKRCQRPPDKPLQLQESGTSSLEGTEVSGQLKSKLDTVVQFCVMVTNHVLVFSFDRVKERPGRTVEAVSRKEEQKAQSTPRVPRFKAN